MYRILQIGGKRYKVNIEKAASPLAFIAWLGAWTIFFRIMFNAMMGW